MDNDTRIIIAIITAGTIVLLALIFSVSSYNHNFDRLMMENGYEKEGTIHGGIKKTKIK